MERKRFIMMVLVISFFTSIHAQRFVGPMGDSNYMINKCYVRKSATNNSGMRPGPGGTMLETCRINGSAIRGAVNTPVSTPSNPTPSRTQSSSQKEYPQCHSCKGSGRVKRNNPISGSFTINTEKVRCSECGEMMNKYGGHYHTTCTSCNGRGYLRY